MRGAVAVMLLIRMLTKTHTQKHRYTNEHKRKRTQTQTNKQRSTLCSLREHADERHDVLAGRESRNAQEHQGSAGVDGEQGPVEQS